MKNIIKLFIVLATVFLFAGCSDFLTKLPETSLAPETYFSSDSELELWTNRFYNMFDDPEDLVGLRADDYVSSSLSSVQNGTRTASSESWGTSAWQYLRFINQLFEYDHQCDDESARLKHEGVAYFFRGLFYYIKVRRYGDIPYYDYVISDTDHDALYHVRDDRGYVMYKVMQDLDKAYELLPDEWSSEAVYHVSKAAALALKSRAALYEGTFRKYHGIADVTLANEGGVTVSANWFLEQAADAAGKVIEMNKYSIYTGNSTGTGPYRDFFIQEDSPTGETILGMRFCVDLLIRHGIQFNMKNQRYSPTRRFANHYLMADGSKIQDVADYDKMTYYEMFQNRDPRMEQTLLAPGYHQIDSDEETIQDFTSTMSGLQIIKFVSDATHDGATTSTTDWPIFRYPEVLLNYAEAKAELGTLTQDDVDKTINVIRSRVNMPGMNLADANAEPDDLLMNYYPNVTSSGMTGAILEVRRERTIELVAEGFRQWDMLRWKEGKFLTPSAYENKGFEGIYFPGLGEYDMNGDGVADILIYSGTKPSTTAAYAYSVDSDLVLSNYDSGCVLMYTLQDYVWNEDRDYLWPIPDDQIDATGGILTQNPGY